MLQGYDMSIFPHKRCCNLTKQLPLTKHPLNPLSSSCSKQRIIHSKALSMGPHASSRRTSQPCLRRSSTPWLCRSPDLPRNPQRKLSRVSPCQASCGLARRDVFFPPGAEWGEILKILEDGDHASQELEGC